MQLGRHEMAMLEIDNRGYWPSECDLKGVCGGFEVLARVWKKKQIRDDDDAMDAALNRCA